MRKEKKVYMLKYQGTKPLRCAHCNKPILKGMNTKIKIFDTDMAEYKFTLEREIKKELKDILNELIEEW